MTDALEEPLTPLPYWPPVLWEDLAAVLTDRERAVLSFALEMAQEEIYARSLEFTDEDQAVLDRLRRLAAATGFMPPAAEGLPPGALDSASDGASMIDAWGRTPYGRNVLAHALCQLARDGWLRAKADETPRCACQHPANEHSVYGCAD